MRLAHAIGQPQISTGALRVGDRLPSIRKLQREQGVSVSTILQAYFWLENRGCIEARPQSGFYVRLPHPKIPREPELRRTSLRPTELEMSKFLVEVVNAALAPANVPFAASTLKADLFPNAKLNQLIRRTIQRNPTHSGSYVMPHRVCSNCGGRWLAGRSYSAVRCPLMTSLSRAVEWKV